MNDAAVSIEHLSRYFGSFKAVDDISLEVRKGETFGFLGANGAGVSVTLSNPNDSMPTFTTTLTDTYIFNLSTLFLLSYLLQQHTPPLLSHSLTQA